MNKAGDVLDTDETLDNLGIKCGGKVELYSEEKCAGFGFGHTDPSQGFDSGKWAKSGANFRMAKRGLNYITTCNNENCEAFE